jgi:hypothetical protein
VACGSYRAASAHVRTMVDATTLCPLWLWLCLQGASARLSEAPEEQTEEDGSSPNGLQNAASGKCGKNLRLLLLQVCNHWLPATAAGVGHCWRSGTRWEAPEAADDASGRRRRRGQGRQQETLL